jgi:MFS family permease
MRRNIRRVLRHPLILPFYLPSLILAFSQGLLIPVLPLYAKAFKVSYGLIGLVVAGESLGRLLGDVPAGMLLRRLGKRGRNANAHAMLWGLGGAMLSTLALFWARSIPEVVMCRLLTGFTNAIYNIARHAYIAEAIKAGKRGRAIAMLGGVFRIGSFVGPMAGGAIAARTTLRVPFLVVGAAYLLAWLVVAFFAHRENRDASPEPGGALSMSGEQHGHLLRVLKSRYRVLVSAGAAQTFAQMIRAGRRVIIPLYAADVIGLDVQAIGLIIGISSAVDMTLFYPAGWIMDHLGRKRAIVPSFTLQTLGMFLVPFTDSFGALLGVATLIGFGNGLGSGSMMTLGADLSPEEGRGEFLGVWRLIGDAGGMGGPLVVGMVADLVVLPMAAWAMAASGLMAAMFFAFLVPETLKR